MSHAVEITGVRADARRSRKLRMGNPAAAIPLLAPFLVLFLAFIVYPTVRVIMLSFTNADIAGVGSYIGAANYVRLVQDKDFWLALWHTVYFVLLTVVPNTLIGLLFAFLVIRMKRLRGLAQALFFLSYVLPVSVVTQIWLWVLEKNYGIINFIFDLKVSWFRTAVPAMPATAFVTIWWTVGFNVLMFVAGLTAIPREYYEAASLDGAKGGFKLFRYITWPLLWPVTSLVLVLQLIAQWQIFNQVYLLTFGGPFNRTRVVLLYMYQQAFNQQHGGYGATISMALFLIILITSIVQIRILRVRAL
jgi:multiple sugar transport system permease protein